MTYDTTNLVQALQAQKFREQQEMERRRHIESLRLKDMDRRQAVEERRKELEKTELERKEAIIQKNRERESRLETQRRHSRGSNLEFAFGSSAPRMMEPRVDSASGYWGSRRWAPLILEILHFYTTSASFLFSSTSIYNLFSISIYLNASCSPGLYYNIFSSQRERPGHVREELGLGGPRDRGGGRAEEQEDGLGTRPQHERGR